MDIILAFPDMFLILDCANRFFCKSLLCCCSELPISGYLFLKTFYPISKLVSQIKHLYMLNIHCAYLYPLRGVLNILVCSHLGSIIAYCLELVKQASVLESMLFLSLYVLTFYGC